MSDREQPGWRHGFRDVSAEMEAIEADLERATRDLVDVLVDEGRAGSTLRIETAAGAVSGTVDHVGTDVVRVVGEFGSIDVALAAVTTIAVVESGVGVRRVTRGHPGSLLSVGRELAQLDVRVEVARSVGPTLPGVIVAAGDSHLELETASGTHFVPIAALVWLRRLDAPES